MAPTLRDLAADAGFRPRAGATPAAIARTEVALGVRLPGEVADLWAFSDGMAGNGVELLSPAAVEQYAGVFLGGFGYVPLTDCNDSNPYAVCCENPLRGVVAHVFHDDEPQLVCRGLGRFLEFVAEARAGGDVSRIDGDFAFDRPARTAEDAATAGELVRAAGGWKRAIRVGGRPSGSPLNSWDRGGKTSWPR